MRVHDGHQRTLIVVILCPNRRGHFGRRSISVVLMMIPGDMYIIRQEVFDMQCSREIYKNNSLADKLVKFVTKARLQIAETKTLFFTCVIQIPTKRGVQDATTQAKPHHTCRMDVWSLKTFMLRDTTEFSS